MPVQSANTGVFHRCQVCRTRLRTELFNAFYRPLAEGATGERIQIQGQAECYYHPGKKAVAPCAGCGRLLCALCEVSMDGRSLCMECLQAGRSRGNIESIEHKRILYDNLALPLAVWPLLFFIIIPITAPAAIYVALRYWRAPGSLLPRTRIRFIVAILIAVMQLVGCAFFVAWMVSR